MAFSRDGRYLLSCGTDGRLRRWDLAVPQDRKVIPLPGVEVQSIAFAAGTGQLLVASRPNVEGERRLSIMSWDLERGAPVETKPIELERPFWQSMYSTALGCAPSIAAASSRSGMRRPAGSSGRLPPCEG